MVFGDRGSISGQVIPKTQKMVLDASLLNTHRYKIQSLSGAIQEKKLYPPLHLSVVAV